MLFQLHPKDYLNSFKANAFVKGLVFGTWQALQSLDNSGRSGSVIFKTDDHFLYIKSLPQSEANQLITMIPDYYNHVRKERDTLLTRFYGLYELKTPKKETIFFVVMENCILTERPIHEVYDLKGSTVNRSTPIEKRSAGVAMKDVDFTQNKRTIALHADMKEALFKQIKSDAQFLADHNILDYSLLVGIHLGNLDSQTDGMVGPPSVSSNKARRSLPVRPTANFSGNFGFVIFFDFFRKSFPIRRRR